MTSLSNNIFQAPHEQKNRGRGLRGNRKLLWKRPARFASSFTSQQAQQSHRSSLEFHSFRNNRHIYGGQSRADLASNASTSTEINVTLRTSQIVNEGLRFFNNGDFCSAKLQYDIAAAQGNIIALHNLGTMYLHGQGIRKDYKKCQIYFRKCSASGLKPSMSQLGYIYLRGFGVQKDVKAAIEWFLKAGEGDGADAYAQFHLGMIYFLGMGTAKDAFKGCKWLRRSANSGFVPAMYNLAMIYMDGLEGIPQDSILAASILKRAAIHGDSNSLNNLGTLYARGVIMKQDFRKALSLFRTAAKKGVSAAMFNLGEMYNHGLGVAQDPKTAAQYYLQAITTAQNPEAEFNLACLFLTGKGPLKQDLRISLAWFEKAAAHGHQGARNNVRVLRHSHIVPVSEEGSPLSSAGTPSVKSYKRPRSQPVPSCNYTNSRSKISTCIKKLGSEIVEAILKREVPV